MNSAGVTHWKAAEMKILQSHTPTWELLISGSVTSETGVRRDRNAGADRSTSPRKRTFEPRRAVFLDGGAIGWFSLLSQRGSRGGVRGNAMYVCMVIKYSRVSINRVRLRIPLVVS